MKTTDKTKKQENRDVWALAVSIVFLTLGLLVIWVTKSFLNIESDATYVSLLIIPLIIYLIVSGKLEEFKGPGGWEAKFAKTANERIVSASEKIEISTEDMQIIQKEGLRILERKRQELDESRPIIMTMELGKQGYYRREAVLSYLEVLSQFRNFRFVVFIDSEKKFVAYIPSWALRGILRIPELGETFIWSINAGEKQNMFRFPGIVKEAISTQSTNVEALQEMTKQNLEALVVIDENRQLKGVVEREQLLSRMMLSLA